MSAQLPQNPQNSLSPINTNENSNTVNQSASNPNDAADMEMDMDQELQAALALSMSIAQGSAEQSSLAPSKSEQPKKKKIKDYEAEIRAHKYFYGKVSDYDLQKFHKRVNEKRNGLCSNNYAEIYSSRDKWQSAPYIIIENNEEALGQGLFKLVTFYYAFDKKTGFCWYKGDNARFDYQFHTVETTFYPDDYGFTEVQISETRDGLKIIPIVPALGSLKELIERETSTNNILNQIDLSLQEDDTKASQDQVPNTRLADNTEIIEENCNVLGISLEYLQRDKLTIEQYIQKKLGSNIETAKISAGSSISAVSAMTSSLSDSSSTPVAINATNASMTPQMKPKEEGIVSFSISKTPKIPTTLSLTDTNATPTTNIQSVEEMRLINRTLEVTKHPYFTKVDTKAITEFLRQTINDECPYISNSLCITERGKEWQGYPYLLRPLDKFPNAFMLTVFYYVYYVKPIINDKQQTILECNTKQIGAYEAIFQINEKGFQICKQQKNTLVPTSDPADKSLKDMIKRLSENSVHPSHLDDFHPSIGKEIKETMDVYDDFISFARLNLLKTSFQDYIRKLQKEKATKTATGDNKPRQRQARTANNLSLQSSSFSSMDFMNPGAFLDPTSFLPMATAHGVYGDFELEEAIRRSQEDNWKDSIPDSKDNGSNGVQRSNNSGSRQNNSSTTRSSKP